jgi:hypothetical protein
MVTPSKAVVLGETPIRGNRLLRKWASTRHFLILTFRDEYGRPLRDPSLSHSALDVLRCELRLGGLRYAFVIASASQVRNHSCFLASLKAGESPEQVAQELRSYFVPNWTDLAKDPIKALSRLGLFCTSDTPVDHPNPLRHARIDDVTTPCGKRLLTDGNGFMSPQLAARANLPPNCSAVQVHQKSNKNGILPSRHPPSRAIRSYELNLAPSYPLPYFCRYVGRA